MYRFIIKMISHSSTEQNVCTHPHPHGHARKSKCCQITLVHTHGHTRGATLVLTVQRGHAQAHLCTLHIRRAASSSRAAAHRAHGAFQWCHPRAPQRRQRSCIDFDGRRCRCCPGHVTGPFPDARKTSMLALRAMHGATGGRARTFRWARAQSLAVPPTRRSRRNLHLQRVGRCKASLTAEAASQRSRAVGARKHAPWWPVFTAPDVKKGVPGSAMARWFITVA